MTKITVDSSAPLGEDLEMGFDGEHFYVSCGGVTIAKRGMSEANDWRDWCCVEPGWSVVESRRPKKYGTGSLHFRYEPPRAAS
jgi:hypothetical protein